MVGWSANNIQLENCNEHFLLWKKFSKSYILQLLDNRFNKIPPHEKSICEQMLIVVPNRM